LAWQSAKISIFKVEMLGIPKKIKVKKKTEFLTSKLRVIMTLQGSFHAQ